MNTTLVWQCAIFSCLTDLVQAINTRWDEIVKKFVDTGAKKNHPHSRSNCDTYVYRWWYHDDASLGLHRIRKICTYVTIFCWERHLKKCSSTLEKGPWKNRSSPLNSNIIVSLLLKLYYKRVDDSPFPKILLHWLLDASPSLFWHQPAVRNKKWCQLTYYIHKTTTILFQKLQANTNHPFDQMYTFTLCKMIKQEVCVTIIQEDDKIG